MPMLHGFACAAANPLAILTTNRAFLSCKCVTARVPFKVSTDDTILLRRHKHAECIAMHACLCCWPIVWVNTNDVGAMDSCIAICLMQLGTCSHACQPAGLFWHLYLTKTPTLSHAQCCEQLCLAALGDDCIPNFDNTVLDTTTQALMREQMRNQDRTMANIESHPEGFNALRRMYENFQEPLMNATAGGGGGQQDPLAALLGAAQTASSNQAAPGGQFQQLCSCSWSCPVCNPFVMGRTVCRGWPFA